MVVELCEDALEAVGIDVPAYDRGAVVPSVVHIGVGAFHRSHQAVYLDAVLAAGDLGWGVCGVGILPGDVRARDAARAQDGLYTLVTTDPQGRRTARVVGSLVRYLYAPDDPGAVIEILSAPSTRIVSLTITEGGYGVDDATGRFDPHDEPTREDMTSGGDTPRSAFGYLAQGLRRRRDEGLAPFTVLSCDNIQGNGRVARHALTSFVRASDPELAAWIEETVSFPSSMVDRITPVTTEETREEVRSSWGIADRWPVRSESYLQWVIEDDFPLGRPDLAAVGVQLVEDVEPYELMKLRLLNASHQAMSYLGILAGYSWVHQTCADPVFAAFLRRYMRIEAIPTLRPVPGIDLDAYCDDLLARFGSEAVRDTLERQVVDASARIPTFLLPVLREQLRAGGPIECCALVLAAWSRYLESRLAPGAAGVEDQRAGDLLAAVAREREEPGALLDYVPVFGDLGGDARLRARYLGLRAELGVRGARGVLEEWMDGSEREPGRSELP